METELMNVELGVTHGAFRMIKTYATLTGKPIAEISNEIGLMVSDLLEQQLKSRIANELGIEVAPVARAARVVVPRFQDTTGISDGLGDKDEDEVTEPEVPVGTTNPFAAVPQTGGLTEEAIQKDMDIEDPDKEAKGLPPATWQDQMAQGEAATDMFAQAAGITDPRITKRRKRPGGKGRAVPLNGNFSEAADAKL